MEQIPNVSGMHSVWLNPVFVNIRKNFDPWGNAWTDSGKYVYAELSFETTFPIIGKIDLK